MKQKQTQSPYDKGELYTHPQETWDKKECAKRSRYAPKDHWGNRPPAGLINDFSTAYNAPGISHRYNGGCTYEGRHYRGESTPVPVIHEDFEIVPYPGWGLRIQLKKGVIHEKQIEAAAV